MSGSGNFLPSLGGGLSHPSPRAVALASGLHAGLNEGAVDGASADAGALGYGKNRLSSNMSGEMLGSNSPQAFGLELPSPEAVAVQVLHDRAIANADRLRDAVKAFSGLASFDKVIQITVTEYDGHVYDLQELSGLMVANNVIASNCFCSITECLIGEDGKPMLSDSLKSTMTKAREAWQEKHL
jgi:hypothetical protein